MWHGAKLLCSSEGCLNLAQKGGACKRHGARGNERVAEVCAT